MEHQSSRSRPKLVIIPGVGDNGLWAYQLFARVWQRRGFDVEIVVFGWIDIDSPLAFKLDAFLDRIRSFGSQPVYIIGISAGGTAAMHALVTFPNVQKIITICTPFDRIPDLHNRLLGESIELVRRNLQLLGPERKAAILSAHAIYDQTVDVRLSRPPGVRTFRVWSVLHVPTVFITMTLYARILARFFQK